MAEIPILKHDSLYLTGGNICIAALESSTNDQRWVIFRVHKSVMGIHSPVFRDMFSLPPAGDAEQFEGVPLVRMPDNASDIETLLKPICFGYKSALLPLPPLHPDTPSAVKPVLSIAKKYEIGVFRDIIMERLESDWPQTLAAWDAHRREVQRMAENNNYYIDVEVESSDDTINPNFEEWLLDDSLPEPASAIRLARDCGEPSILPTTFYQLATTETRCNRRAREDLDNIDGGDLRTVRWNLLEEEDWLCLMKGQSSLRHHIRMFYDDIHCSNTLVHGRQPCRVKEQIKGMGESMGKYHSHSEHDALVFFQILGAHFRRELEKDRIRPPMCVECADKTMTMLSDIRDTIWNELGFRLRITVTVVWTT